MFVCLDVCFLFVLFLYVSSYVSPLLHLVSFGQLLRCADKRIVNIMKVHACMHACMNKMQVEFIRFRKQYRLDSCLLSRSEEFNAMSLIPPSHRTRGATAVLVRHKPQWHRHDRRGSTVVPSLIVVAPRKTVKTADLRGGTAATFNMFRRVSAVLVPSHRRRGATAVLVRHKPHWHRHDRRGSAVVPSVIAVAPRKTVKIADLRGGTAKTLNMFKTSAGHRELGQSAVGSPRHRHDRRGTAVVPP